MQKQSVFPHDSQQVQRSQQEPFNSQQPSTAQQEQPHWQMHFSHKHFVDDFTKPAQIKPVIIITAIAPSNESIQLDLFAPVIYNYLGYYSYNYIMSKKKINKKYVKLSYGKCRFCDCSEYALLDCHKIIEGNKKEGPGYVKENVVVCCALCHRKIHANIIKIDRYYTTTLGKQILHYWLDGVEHWD